MQKVGYQQMEITQIYDMVVLGGGPAGTTAALYAVRAGLTVLIIENQTIGGEIVATDRLDNYPAFPEGISGAEFGLLLQQQMENLEVAVVNANVEAVDLFGEVKVVQTSGLTVKGRTIVIATGTEPNLLGIEGETELRGRGVSYCATCDAAFFRGREVAVIGGGNAALEETIFLEKFASKIFLIHRRDQFRGVKGLQERVLSLPGVEVLWNTTVTKIEGGNKVEALLINRDGSEKRLQVDGVFIYAGRKPNTAFLGDDTVEVDQGGFIITTERMETSREGVYAAGDIRKKYLRQVITAAADGAIAATAAAQYLLN